MGYFLRGLGNFLVVTFIGALLLLGIVTIAVQFPSVQTWAVNQAAQRISLKLGYPIEIGRVNIKWFDVVSLENVVVKDPQRRRMIDVGRIDVNLQLKQIIEKSTVEIRLDEVTLFRPKVRLIKDARTGGLNIDGFIAKISELTSSGDTTVRDQNIPFYITKALITDGNFSLEDPYVKRIRNSDVFDYSNFELRKINGRLSDFLVLGDTIAFNGKNLNTIDTQTGLEVHKLNTQFLYCNTKMELADLDADIGKSHLKEYISFNYKKPVDLSADFNNRVVLKARLRDSRVASQDLGLFAGYLLSLEEMWRISGDFEGTVKDFKLTDAHLAFGNTSQLVGDFAFQGLPEFSKTNMNFKFNSTIINTLDLVQYYPKAKLHGTLSKFGQVKVNGAFVGNVQDFSLKGNFETDAGLLDSDLVFHISDSEKSTYKGSVRTAGLDLGLIFDQPEMLQKLDFSGHIDGRGFDLQNMATNLDATINRFGFKGYDYKNLALKGNLQKSYFEGRFSANDTNFVCNLDGTIDLVGEINEYDIRGEIEQANLKMLGFSKEEFNVQTFLDIRLKGNTIDDLFGAAEFRNAFLNKPGLDRNLVIDTLAVRLDHKDEHRMISLVSEFVDVTVQGTFVPTQAIKDLTALLKEYKLYFFGNEVERSTYYEKKNSEVIASKYEIDFEAKTYKMDRILDFFLPDLYVSPGAKVEGSLKMGNTALVTVNAKMDTVRYFKNEFFKSEVDIATSKFVNNSEVLASGTLTSERQNISSIAPTEHLDVEAAWNEDHINFNWALDQTNSTNKASLNGEVRFISSGLDIRMAPDSKLYLLDGVWEMSQNNQVLIEGKSFSFRNLMLSNGRQKLSVNGDIKGDSSKNVLFEARYFNLATLNPVLNTKLGGILDGKMGIVQRGISSELAGDFNVEALSYDRFELGNFIGSGEWDRNKKQLVIDAFLEKNTKKVMSLTGSYFPDRVDNSFDIKAVFLGAELNPVESFSKGLISDLSGQIKGNVFLKGSLERPLLEGELMIENGRARFDYLQSVFTFSDKVSITENEITVKKMKLTDPDGNTALISGGVYHDGLKYFSLGFDAELKSFKILNTAAEDNEDFYGTAYVSGKASVYGRVENLNIDATVTSNKGTRIYIPLDGATEVVTQDYIRFVSVLEKEKDSVAVMERRRQIRDVSGIKMNFNFNITPEAYCEIQLDRQTGDIIKAYGKGLLNMKIDTKGDFVMVGSYEIEKGDFTYTFQNALNKKFDLKAGSRISWTGSPYDAMLDVRAGYQQNVSLMGILKSSTQSAATNPNLMRRYPVEITLTLTERLTSPKIGYSLKVREFPPGEFTAVTAFENRLLNDEQELSRQVSSFLVFNQLLSLEDQFFAQSGAGIGNSVSELISNQISRWASALDENLEVGVTGLSLDQNALDNLQLRFSYRFLNDRFRITRDGRLTYGQNQYDAASLIGDWTLEYWWTRSGSVRLKAFNRNIQSIQNSGALLGYTQTTGGLSVSFNHNFNRLGPGMRKLPAVPIVPTPLDTIRLDTITRRNLSSKIPLTYIPD